MTNFEKVSFGLKIYLLYKGWSIVYMHETTKCGLINRFYFHK